MIAGSPWRVVTVPMREVTGALSADLSDSCQAPISRTVFCPQFRVCRNTSSESRARSLVSSMPRRCKTPFARTERLPIGRSV